jgi:hypothetical protein
MAHALRIALIADIHHGMDQGTKLGSAALDRSSWHPISASTWRRTTSDG